MGNEKVITTFCGIDVKKLNKEDMEALADYVKEETKKAEVRWRKDQIMKDFLAYNTELEVDESNLIEIRETLLAELQESEGEG